MYAFVSGNINLLKQARSLIISLSGDQYRDNALPPFNSGVGKHIRHVLDFYNALLHPDGNRIDYDRRGRDVSVETEPDVAVHLIDQVCEALAELKEFDAPVWTKNEEAAQTPQDEGYTPSTLGRELQFLVNHTVHHFAVIAILMHGLGIATPPEFGVAVSTLIHWHQIGREAAS